MIRPEIQTLPAYSFRALPYRVKLDQNESPYDVPEELKTRIAERLLNIPFHRYPDMHANSLRRAIAEFHAWPEAGVVVSGGSNVLIQAVAAACGLGRRVLSVIPTFSMYALQATLMGAELVEIPLEPDFSLPMEALRGALAAGEGVFFLANPAAPTGNLFSEREVRALLEGAGERWTVVIDEAYAQFSGTDFSPLVQEYPNVVCLRTFSKAFGLAGVRLGYALAHPALAEGIQKVLLPFSVSALQLIIGLIVLEHPEYVETRVQEAVAERARLLAGLRDLPGVEVYPSHTNFLLFRVRDAEAFYTGLLERGVLIRRQDHLPGLAGCLRVSVGTPEENGIFLETATEVAQGRQEVARG